MQNQKVIRFSKQFFLTLVWLFPLAWTIFSSFKSHVEVMTVGYHFTPVEWVLDNYIKILKSDTAPIVRWFGNSMFISTLHTLLAIIISSLAAYGYARLDFKGRDTMFWGLMATMMFPAVVNLIPTFKIIHWLKWIDTPWAIIFPGLGGVFNIYLIRQFLLGIPKDLDEAAKIDGANHLQIYVKIIVPLSKPVLTVVGLFSFTGSWNDFLWPSIVMNDIDKMPLTPGLKLLQGAFAAQLGPLSAGAVIAIIPPIILYLFAQSYFLEGINLSSGVKG
ncbi:MAG TPA: carbohydrate ABC transporter permease [Epulopiscium sp.]|nr:carbohydrate ABC transporter permease [Candidatus Epulonipiscium sp.]